MDVVLDVYMVQINISDNDSCSTKYISPVTKIEYRVLKPGVCKEWQNNYVDQSPLELSNISSSIFAESETCLNKIIIFPYTACK